MPTVSDHSGQAAFSASSPSGYVRAFSSAAQISPEIWVKFFGGYWKDHRFYHLAEETLPDQAKYAYLQVENRAGDVIALQPVFEIRQDLILGTPEILTRSVRFIRKFIPHFLEPQMLMAGCIAGEGRLGGDPEAVREAVELYAHHRKIRLITFKEFPASARIDLEGLTSKHYARIPSYPGVKLPISFANIEAYYEKILSKNTRKNIRKKFRESELHGKIEMEVVTRLDAGLIGEIHALYLQVYERSEEHFEKLTPDYFAKIADFLPDRVRFFLWRNEGRLVAFNLCLVHDGILYDDYLGLDYAVALDFSLYFVTFRDVLTWAIGQGIREYYSTPLSYEPKLHLRFELVPLDLYVRHTSSWINPLYTGLARAMGPLGKDETVKKFPNSAEVFAEIETPPSRSWFAKPLFLVYLSALLDTASEVVLKIGADHAAEDSTTTWTAIRGLASPWVWAGIVLGLIAMSFWLKALRRIPLSVAFSHTSIVYVTIPLACWLFLGETINLQRWLGIFFVLAGIMCIAKPRAKFEEAA